MLCFVFQWPSAFVLGKAASSRVSLGDVVTGTVLSPPLVPWVILTVSALLARSSRGWGTVATVLLSLLGVVFTIGDDPAKANAVKIARLAAGRPRGRIIARDRSYHGATHLAMALSGDSRTRELVDPESFGIEHVMNAVSSDGSLDLPSVAKINCQARHRAHGFPVKNEAVPEKFRHVAIRIQRRAEKTAVGATELFIQFTQQP